MATYHNRQIVKYSIVFQQQPGNVLDLMRTIDRSTVVKIIARMNHLARTKMTSTVQQVLNMWFGTSNAEFRTEVRNRIIQGYAPFQVPIEELGIINMWSNLNILDLLLSEPENDLPKKSADESERDFFRIYLSINEIFADGSNTIVASLRPLEHKQVGWYARSLMTTMIKFHDFANTSPKEVMASQVIKAYYSFQFLESTGHQELNRLFLQAYGVETWKDYFRLILPLCSGPVSGGDGSGMYYFELQPSDDLEQRTKFISRLAMVGSESYAVTPDFVHSRSKPLYETEPDRFLVLDEVLIINRVNSSMFFELKDIATSQRHLHPRYDNFFSFYTTEFVEKYLAYTLLDNIYKKTSYYRISGDDIKTKFGITQEPDYYIRNGRKVFLFEVKGSMLTGLAKQSFDYLEVEAELKKKYYQKPGSNKNIGIMQLLDRIRLLIQGPEPIGYDPASEPKRLKIFPILLTTERALCSPGMNYIFNEWFFEAVENDQVLRTKKEQIHPLTIVDVDTLINFTDLFKGKPALIEETISNYHKFVQKRTPTISNKKPLESIKKNMNQAMQSYPEYLMSLYNFQMPSLFMEIGKSVAFYRKPD